MLHLLDIFRHMYPDTNMHELDLSWILKEVAEFDKQLDELEERIIEAAVKASKEYIDAQVAEIRTEFENLSNQVNNLSIQFNQTVQELQNQYTTFVTAVDNSINRLVHRIEDFEATVQNEIIGLEASMDLKIEANNEYLLEEVSKGLAKVKVVNYFTGELIPVQEMFDYLAIFHLENPITYAELAASGIDYTALAALNMTYTELATKGKSFIIP